MAVLWSLYHAFVALRSRRTSLLQGIAFASVMAIIAELIMLTTDFHLQAPATAIYFMLCLALAWKARFMASGRQSQSSTLQDAQIAKLSQAEHKETSKKA